MIIDMEIFNQILELEDDEDSFEFSLGMAQAYISQARDAFNKMDKALYVPTVRWYLYMRLTFNSQLGQGS